MRSAGPTIHDSGLLLLVVVFVAGALVLTSVLSPVARLPLPIRSVAVRSVRPSVRQSVLREKRPRESPFALAALSLSRLFQQLLLLLPSCWRLLHPRRAPRLGSQISPMWLFPETASLARGSWTLLRSSFNKWPKSRKKVHLCMR